MRRRSIFPVPWRKSGETVGHIIASRSVNPTGTNSRRGDERLSLGDVRRLLRDSELAPRDCHSPNAAARPAGASSAPATGKACSNQMQMVIPKPGRQIQRFCNQRLSDGNRSTGIDPDPRSRQTRRPPRRPLRNRAEVRPGALHRCPGPK